MPEKITNKVQNHYRLAWVDNLRTFIIFLVVSMHACVTYSYVGGWYINYPPGPSAFEQIIFIIWQAHLQSFFMGLLFFIAGVFAHRTMKKRGIGGLMKERWIRLGLPSMLYMICIQPLIVYATLQEPKGPAPPLVHELLVRVFEVRQCSGGERAHVVCRGVVDFLLCLCNKTDVRWRNPINDTSITAAKALRYVAFRIWPCMLFLSGKTCLSTGLNYFQHAIRFFHAICCSV